MHVCGFLKLHSQLYICDWICKKGLICAIRNTYNFEIFNLIYLENDQSCLHVFLYKSIAIQGNLLCLLYTGQLAELPAILDSFLLAQPIPLALLQCGGGRGATEWRAKATSSLKNQMASIGTIFTSTCYAKQLNPQPNSSASRVVNHSWLSACQGKMGPIESHPSTLGHQTGLRKMPE